MNSPFNQNVLIESPSLRTSTLSNLDDARSSDVLNKAKAFVFALWNGQGWATVEQLAQYFQCSIPGIKHIYERNSKEFRDNETKKLTGKDLSDARSKLERASRTAQVRVFSPLGALRIAMLLTESEVAAQVRTIILDLVVAVPKITPVSPSQTPSLPPVEQRLHTLVLAMKTLAELTGGRLNPYMEQQFKDYAGNLLAEHNRKLLTPSEERWLGVVNFAEIELGKKVPISGPHYRGHLGTWVRTFYPQLDERQETRLVNGVQQPIYVYACHEPTVAAGLTKAVEEFFAHLSPGVALRQAGAFASKKEPVLTK
ncbi:hypothetical protein H6G97_46525 [Nostoc flagelliforme FACHB-838]|uniref:Uncharacterized protein n=1 Tax=Nostoc flagelliforme FACHB-838 TaxID=2692904 RepID=A0ABR8E3R9_9NOSO|nr:hypothetical protein [Nostoc flagelliforme]MBD2536349.1 hypothetical protein [Nostoc flagelliforme FACHB-838]